MSYSRSNVENFLNQTGAPEEDRVATLARADEAIAEFSSSEDTMFSGGKLEYVLGDTKLVQRFLELWETGRLHSD